MKYTYSTYEPHVIYDRPVPQNVDPSLMWVCITIVIVAFITKIQN
jgi:hypothetical protein